MATLTYRKRSLLALNARLGGALTWPSLFTTLSFYSNRAGDETRYYAPLRRTRSERAHRRGWLPPSFATRDICLRRALFTPLLLPCIMPWQLLCAVDGW